MPELPEVETIVKDLRKKIVGLKIKKIWTDSKKLIRRPDFDTFEKQVVGREIEGVRRKAKYILIDLSKKKTILIHQKLTGHLLVGHWKIKKGIPIPKEEKLKEKDNKYIHVLWWFENGLMMGLSNLRKFAEVELWDTEKIEDLKKIKKLGPEPLTEELTFSKFKKQLKGRRKNIKKCLLDQEIVAGIGNIYSDEILWDAKINPFRSVEDLREEELKKIFTSIGKIIKKAIKLKGESISDYRTPDGGKGNYDEYRKVYRREGEKCPRDGEVIKRKKTGGRSAHYCPKCQK